MAVEAIEELTKKLISFKTVTGNNRECSKLLDFVEAQLTHHGASVKRFCSKGVPSLVASNKPGKHFKYMLVGHVDVVPADEEQFVPLIKGDRLYGRGAIDMKGQDAVMILLMKSLAKSPVPVALMLTSDEERGGEHGVKFLLDKGYSCDFFIAPDGGTGFKLVTKEKGTLWLEIKTRGKASHGSRPWKGDNAINKLIERLGLINGLFQDDTAGHWTNTMNLSMIRGGTAPNQVPAEATAVIDIRWVDDWKGLLGSIGRIVDYRILQFGNMFHTDPRHPEMKRLRSVIESILGRKIKTTFEHGASDARFFTAKHIPGAVFNPLGRGAHTIVEWVSLKSLEQFYRILKRFVQTG